MNRKGGKELDAHLRGAALAGDRPAQDALVRFYWPRIRATVASRVLRWPSLHSELDDIHSDVWLEFLRRDCKVMRYWRESGPKAFGAYLELLAGRLTWRCIKKRLRHPTVELGPEPTDDTWAFEARLICSDLLDTLVQRAELDDTDRALLRSHFGDGQTVVDVARELGLKGNTAHKQKRRLERRLQGLAKGLLDEGDQVTSTPTDGPSISVALVVAAFAVDTNVGVVTNEIWPDDSVMVFGEP